MQTQNREDVPVALPDKKQGRWMLLLLVFFFSVPLVAVLLMHHYDWHPQGRSHGDLITPHALNIPGNLMTIQGLYVEPELLKNKWSMVYVTHNCQAACEERLHVMRQLHASLAKDIKRVQRILIASDGNLQGLHQQYPDIVILNHPENELMALRNQFDVADMPAGSDNRIYLVDPLGNLMMSFSDKVTPVEIRKDLTRLLAYSWAG